MIAKIVAKAVIQNQASDVLLLKRSTTDPRRPGEWDFPGGGIEDGEDMVVGVAREIREEAGLTIATNELRLVYTATEFYEPKAESVCRLLFVGKISTGEVQLSFEHDEYKWVDIDTALSEFPHPFYGAGLKYARDHGLLSVPEE